MKMGQLNQNSLKENVHKRQRMAPSVEVRTVGMFK